LSSMKFNDLANGAIGKVPGVGQAKAVDLKDVAFDLSSQFRLLKGIMNLSGFHMKSPEDDELLADGTLGLNKEVDLHGTAYLVNAPVAGSIRAANSDAKGRLILPLKIQGLLTKPQVAFANETITQLLGNT